MRWLLGPFPTPENCWSLMVDWQHLESLLPVSLMLLVAELVSVKIFISERQKSRGGEIATVLLLCDLFSF